MKRPLDTGPGLPEVLPYHWSDREKFYSDVEYLQDLESRLLSSLGSSLEPSGTPPHSSRFWRIVLGTWLGTYSSILWDRWETVRLANEAAGKDAVSIAISGLTLSRPGSYADFVRQFVSAEWNQALYEAIAEQFRIPLVTTEKHREGMDRSSAMNTGVASVGSGIPSHVALTVNFIASRLMRPKVLIQSSGFGSIREALVAASFGQVPLPLRLMKDPLEDSIAINDFDLKNFDPASPFEEFVVSRIKDDIPAAYLSQSRMVEAWLGRTATRPRLIASGPGLHSDDQLKFRAAQAVERGARLVAFQHGGFYGQGKYSFAERHETLVSDRYFTWGWTGAGGHEVPAGSFKKLPRLKKRNSKTDGELLVVLGSSPRLSYAPYSSPMGPELVQYFEFIGQLLRSLQPEVKSRTRVRLYPTDYGWGEEEYLNVVAPGISSIHRGGSYGSDLANARLVLGTFNATTHLESIALGIPTIMAWSPSLFEMRDSVKHLHQSLRRVGVLHDDSDACAKFIGSIWSDVSAWWRDSETTLAVGEFEKEHVSVHRRPLKAIRRILSAELRSSSTLSVL